MGANHSHDGADYYSSKEGKQHLKSDFILPSKRKGGKGGKPSPPSQPKAFETAHNSITLSWQPPRHNAGCTVFAYTVEMSTPRDPKAWTVLTRSCQTSRYQVKGLQTAGEYIFRVKAENIHGLSKASRPSDVIVTNMCESVSDNVYVSSLPSSSMTTSATFPPTSATSYETGSDVIDGNIRVRTGSVPRRRPSVNLHIEGTVSAILNHTDIEVKATTPNMEVKNGTLTLNRSDDSLGFVRGGRERATSMTARNSSIGTLQRDAVVRSSLPVGARKRSLPILLPGTRTNSLIKLRDSQTLPNIKAKGEMTNSNSMDSLKRRMGGLGISDAGPGQDSQRQSVRRSRTGSDICSNYSSASSGSIKEDNADSKSSCSCTCSCGKDLEDDLKKIGVTNSDDDIMKVAVGMFSNDDVDDIKKQNKANEDSGSSNTLSGKCDKCGKTKRNSVCSDKGKCSDYCTNSYCSASQRNSQATDDSEPLSEDSGNPWERHDDVSHNDVIMTAPLCDDVKLALYTRSVPDGGSSWTTVRNMLESGDDYSDFGHHQVGHQPDFRALRTLLHSDDIIVKPTRSLPDMAGAGGGGGGGLNKANRNSFTNSNNNNKLTTIVDIDEEEEVRVTTL